MLAWARQVTGWTVDDAAGELGVRPERWAAWEAGRRLPTMNQVREIAELIEQPLGVFFLPEPPELPAPLVAFRRLPGAGSASPGLARDVRRAISRQAVALSLLDEDGVGTGSALRALALRSTDDPSVVGPQLRAALEVPIVSQLKARPEQALTIWRRAVERQGVLVFETRSATVADARGLCLPHPRLPVIVLNGKDAVTARAFTLLHECVHLALGAGSVCDDADREQERFCDRVAAVALIPREAFVAEVVARVADPERAAWTDSQLRALAARFAVSEQALLLRLIGLRLARQAEYDDRAARFRVHRAKGDAGGGPIAPPILSPKYHGSPYPQTVLEALGRDAVTYTDVARYLGLGTKHVGKLELELMRAS